MSEQSGIKNFVRLSGFYQKQTRDGNMILVGGRVLQQKIDEVQDLMNRIGAESLEMIVLPNTNKLSENHPDYSLLVQEKRPRPPQGGF